MNMHQYKSFKMAFAVCLFLVIANGDTEITQCTNIRLNIHTNEMFGNPLCGSIIFPAEPTFVPNAQQYAYSSYPSHFSPSMLLIPQCHEDISLMLDFAYQCDYKVSIRSGGHQFAGLSSCNSDDYNCVQIILKEYDNLTIFTDNNTAIAQVGVTLETLFKELDKNDLFSPGGAESSVGLGGHCQTGGVGYLMRSFGLFVDTIFAFDMMIWNGTVLHVTETQHDDLFWAVLGGGPGNFGIILTLYMHVFANSDYSVVGVTTIWMYDEEVAKETGSTWLELMDTNDDTLMLWAIIPNFELNVFMVLVSYLYVETNDRSWDGFGYDNLLKPFLDLNISAPIMNTVLVNRSVSSLMANEFLIPSDPVPQYRYSQRFQGTTQTWNDAFIDDMVDRADVLINDDVNELGVNITIGFEVLFEKYGGVVAQSDRLNRTALAWRDLRQGMGMRIFYKDDTAGEIQANWQETSWKHWLSVPEFYNNEDIRYYGYSHVTDEEGEFDMTQQWKYYYRTEDRYNKLKQIKNDIDPCDIFHFVFSIPVDDDSECPEKP
eukprot:255562_1